MSNNLTRNWLYHSRVFTFTTTMYKVTFTLLSSMDMTLLIFVSKYYNISLMSRLTYTLSTYRYCVHIKNIYSRLWQIVRPLPLPRWGTELAPVFPSSMFHFSNLCLTNSL